MEFNDLEKVRFEKSERLREQGIDPYPTRSGVTHTIREALDIFTENEEGKAKTNPAPEVSVGGRIRSKRSMGKLAFANIEDGTGKIQLMLRINELGQPAVDQFSELFDLGDYIQADGDLMRTRTGEITLLLKHFHVLAKAITPLPANKDEEVNGQIIRHATLTDPETRFRERYADLAVNPEVRQIFMTRAKIVRALQEFLDHQGFLEVETPILQPIYGGAAAKPFTTFHNQLKQDLYLRISFELYLKRLLVGGLERVYEIGRDFRNEGVSFKHNPEFTQLEFYIAYADYLKIKYVDEKSLFDAMQKARLNPKPGSSRGKLIDAMIGDLIEPNLIQPTFLYNYPRDISPLAKNIPGDPSTVERFEGFVGGLELCNAFTELNDPLEQEKRFLEMGRAYTNEDEERHPMDEDYLKSMAYGMPPNGGFGMGVDRLTMLLTNKHSIREVILFPHLRKQEQE